MHSVWRILSVWAFLGLAAPASPLTAQGGAPIQSVAEVPISTGFDHACALTANGEAYCWGSNSDGELGDGSMDDRAEPVRVAGGHTFRSLSAGHNRTCGLTSAGAAYCWGKNDFGELGDGTSREARAEPTPVTGGLTFRSISVGQHHTCGVTTDGQAYCWGRNFTGELGDGTTTNRVEPTRVGGNVSSFQSISAGSSHSCALNSAGAAYCWGANYSGEVGDGSQQSRLQPAAVTGRLSFTSISTGINRTCGLTTSGEAYCWGLNGQGLLGDGSDGLRTAPSRVSTEERFSMLSAGAHHSCGVAVGGPVHCWGHNGFGQVGGGTTANRPTPVEVARGQQFGFVSAGTYQTCAVTTAGEAFCWGRDLANPRLATAERVLIPARVGAGLTFGLPAATGVR